MNFKSISIWIKVVLIGFAICGITLAAIAFPQLGESIVNANPEFSYAYTPWMIFLCIALVPCYAVLVLGWIIASNISRDSAFSQVNARLLKAVAFLSAGDSAFFLLGNIVLLFLNMNHPGIVLLSLPVVFIGFAVCVASYALSHLTIRAADIEDENALTI